MAEAGSDDDKTVNLMGFSSTERPTVRVGLAIEQGLLNQERCLLDVTVVDDAADQESGIDRSEAESPLMVSESIEPATAPKPPTAEALTDQLVDDQRCIEELQKMCKTLIAEKTSLEIELRSTMDDSIRQDRHLRTMITELDDYKDFHDSEFTILEAERQDLQQRCNEMQQFFNQYTSTSDSLKDRDNANRQCEQLFTEVHSLRRQVNQLERIKEQYIEVKKAFDDLQSQKCDTSGVNPNDEGVISQLKSLKKAHAQLVAQLAAKVEELEAFRSAALEQAKDAEVEFEKRDAEIVRLEEELESANQRHRLLQQSTKNSASADLGRRSNENELLRQLEAENQVLKDQLASERDRAIRLEVHVRRLEKTCDDADASEEDLRNKIADLEERIQEMQRQEKLDRARLAESVACGDQRQHSDKKIAQLEEMVALAESNCQEKEEELATLRDKYRAICDKYRRLKESKRGNDGAGVESAHGIGDPVQIVTGGGSSIAAMGKCQLEAQIYQLRKQVERLEGEKAKLPPQHSVQGQKENDGSTDGTPGRMRRSVSECEKSGQRPLQESSVSNGSVGNLYAATGRPPLFKGSVGNLHTATYHAKLFPPVFKK